MRKIAELMDLSGRRALVIGGAGHIGTAMCEGLVELGAMVAIVDRNIESCKKSAAQLDQIRADATLFFRCDLLKEQQTRRTLRQAVKSLGGLDILIHCPLYVNKDKKAGWVAPFEHQSTRTWDESLWVNLTSAFIAVQETADALRRSGHGNIILVGSTYGVVGPDWRLYGGTTMGNPVGYGAAKGGLIQTARYLATMLAPAIRVNVISPGGVWRNQPASFYRRYVSRTPLRRMAIEEDLKGAAVFLAGDAASYITGHNLMVDGGWTAW